MQKHKNYLLIYIFLVHVKDNIKSYVVFRKHNIKLHEISAKYAVLCTLVRQ